jgi:nitroimidazol reductase NimA-like FMN-containing flavoprotein (pyridoxamine 5'-phosphate oxidase superfamily)
VNRRALIAMSGEEIAAFLAQQRTLVCATLGPRGWPHAMALWYALREGADGEPQIWSWTYAASQKALNIARDPRATLELHAGERYDELRGVTIEAAVTVHSETAQVAALGREIFARCAPEQFGPEVVATIERQAPKRIALQFQARRTASFDHRKLAR